MKIPHLLFPSELSLLCDPKNVPKEIAIYSVISPFFNLCLN